MKKFLAIITLLIGGITLLGGCDTNNDDFTPQSYGIEATEIVELQIEVQNRKIEILPATDDKIHLDYAQSSKEFYDITLTDGVLVMTAQDAKEWTDFIGTSADLANRTIRVQIPDGVLASLTISTTNEDVSLPALSFEQGISINVNNGNIIFEQLAVGRTIDLVSKNGNISGAISGGYDDFAITTTIKKGESNLPAQKNGGVKTLNVTANNGDINIEFIPTATNSN